MSDGARDISAALERINRRSSDAAGLQPACWLGVAAALRETLGGVAHLARETPRNPYDLAPAFAELDRWLTVAKRWQRALPASGLKRPAGPFARAASRASGPRDRLSILLLAKDEEERLPRCLASIVWADELVVVDGQSTDRTAELCRRAGATVVSRPFSGSFAEERNAGLAVATGDWVLQMDADERVTSGLRAAIERVLAAQEARFEAYRVFRRNVFLGRFMRHGGWYHDHLCLFRRVGHRYHGLVHERLDITGAIGHLRADLEHEPFRSIEQFVTRHDRYTTLQARELLETQGRLPWSLVERKLWRRPINRWWKFYVKKQGFREGVHGVVFSTLYAWVEWLVWAKYAQMSYPGRLRVEGLDG